MLTVQNLSCRRGGRVIFRETGFATGSGGFALVMGANGSGKSSLLRVLAGLIVPAAGAVRWENRDVSEDAAAHRARVHYIGHLDALKAGLTVREMLGYWCALHGAKETKLDQSLNSFALTALADRPIRRLSAGQKRRLSLTRLALVEAPLWLLDEPTSALDVTGQGLLREGIARHRAKGGIVIAATHDDLNVPNVQVITLAGGGR